MTIIRVPKHKYKQYTDREIEKKVLSDLNENKTRIPLNNLPIHEYIVIYLTENFWFHLEETIISKSQRLFYE